MRAFPFERLRRPLDLGKPERGPVVVRRREPKTLGLEGEAAHARRRAPGSDRTGLVTRADLLARAPGIGAAPHRERVDPATLLAGDFAEAGVGADGNHAPVVAAGEKGPAVADGDQDRR